jgi:2-oxoglutarate ferredoxin oxidoreductase subunit delta
MKPKMRTGRSFRAVVDIERCKGCGLCLTVCPRNSLSAAGKINRKGIRYVYLEDPEACTGCGLCALICPDCAIEIKEIKKNEK